MFVNLGVFSGCPILTTDNFKVCCKIYDISLEVKVKESGEDGDDGIDVGLDKHLKQQSESSDSTFSREKTSENYKNEKQIVP